MRLFCLLIMSFFLSSPVARAAGSDCWEKTGEAAIQACSKIINSKQASDQSDRAQTLSLAYFHRGNAYFVKRNYDRAIDNYDDAIRLNPKYLKAYHIRGNAYYLKGFYEKALADFDQVIHLDPSYKAVTYYRQLTQKKLLLLKKEQEKK